MEANTLEKSVLDFIGNCKTPVFVCGSNNAVPPTIILHIPASSSSRKVKRDLGAHLGHSGFSAKVKITYFKEDQLAKAATLQELTAHFQHDWILYDPTGSIRRARAIAHAVADCRHLLGERLKGVYLELSGRRLHAVLDKAAIEKQGADFLVLVREVEALIRRALSDALCRDHVAMDMDVYAGFGAPTVQVVAVDAQSLKALKVVGLRLSQVFGRRALPYAAAAALGLCASPAFAAGPAVSGVNAKLEALGGSVDGNGSEAAAGSISFPMGVRFGAQLDAAYGEIGDDTLKGAALHLFTRDPESFLLGAYVSYTKLDDLKMNRAAFEGEAYVGPFTVAAQAGHQSGDVEDEFFGGVDLRYYPIENLKLEAGGSIVGSTNQGHIGIEFMPALDVIPGLSIFADAAVGEDEYEHAFAGVRYYFGRSKTLIKKQREDDPVNPIISGVTSTFSLRQGHKKQDVSSTDPGTIDPGTIDP